MCDKTMEYKPSLSGSKSLEQLATMDTQLANIEAGVVGGGRPVIDDNTHFDNNAPSTSAAAPGQGTGPRGAKKQRFERRFNDIPVILLSDDDNDDENENEEDTLDSRVTGAASAGMVQPGINVAIDATASAVLTRATEKRQSNALEQPNQPTVTDLNGTKRDAVQNNPFPNGQIVETPIVRQLNNLSALPLELFCIIMNKLKIWEHFTIRVVCHSLMDKVHAMYNELPKDCLKINVKASTGGFESRCLRTWQPNESLCRMHFDFVYKEPVIVPTKQAHISIWDRAFNFRAASAIGSIFNKVKILIIYWDTDDSEQNIDSLVAMLRQFDTQSNVVTTFGLIASSPFTNLKTLPKICARINTNLAPLKQLHLIVPEFFTKTNHQSVKARAIYSSIMLANAIRFATDISTGTFVSTSNLLKFVGATQLESLTIRLWSSDAEQRLTLASLDSNKDKIVSVKRLQLTNICESNELQRLLICFPNVEQLYLECDHLREDEDFGIAWIRTLMPLKKLTELTLVNYCFENTSLGWGQRKQLEETVKLAQLRKLTFASPILFFCLCKKSNPMDTPLIPSLLPEDIGDTINMRFPGLQELNMWSGDYDIHDTYGSTWQTVERLINDVLPTSLPLLPGLRVNIQLCHPVMCNQYLSFPAIVQNLTIEMAASRANMLDSNFVLCNALVLNRHRVSNALYGNVDNDIFGQVNDLALDELFKKQIQTLAQTGVQIQPHHRAQALARAQAQLHAQEGVYQNIRIPNQN